MGDVCALRGALWDVSWFYFSMGVCFCVKTEQSSL